mmetsp:Transcript_30584/g.69993  ORF Transcript_30584/g.69993 Transcript_30584/m.69993 type:complete len:218 (+) Transcript_30584:571-1224(+)
MNIYERFDTKCRKSHETVHETRRPPADGCQKAERMGYFGELRGKLFQHRRIQRFASSHRILRVLREDQSQRGGVSGVVVVHSYDFDFFRRRFVVWKIWKYVVPLFVHGQHAKILDGSVVQGPTKMQVHAPVRKHSYHGVRAVFRSDESLALGFFRFASCPSGFLGQCRCRNTHDFNICFSGEEHGGYFDYHRWVAGVEKTIPLVEIRPSKKTLAGPF